MKHTDRNQSLQELDGKDWGEPDYDSHLVRECHRLRRVPLVELATEDLRILIGQHIGMDYLMPLALEQLRAEPLIEGDCYAGDLLAAVLRAGKDFWQQHPEPAAEVAEIARCAEPFFIDNEMLKDAYELFKKHH